MFKEEERWKMHKKDEKDGGKKRQEKNIMERERTLYNIIKILDPIIF